jgi:hypothetical protein
VSTGQNAASGSTPEPSAYRQEQASSGPVRFYTIDEVAALCKRSPGTIHNLISQYQLRAHRAWTVYKRRRRRVIVLSPAVARWCQRVTLLRDAEARKDPPSWRSFRRDSAEDDT